MSQHPRERTTRTRVAPPMERREFLRIAAAGALLPALPALAGAAPQPSAAARACVLVWLSGGVPSRDTWDPKPCTPFRPGMWARDLLATTPSIPTAQRGVRIGAGLSRVAAHMDRAWLVRSLVPGSPHDRHAGSSGQGVGWSHLASRRRLFADSRSGRSIFEPLRVRAEEATAPPSEAVDPALSEAMRLDGASLDRARSESPIRRRWTQQAGLPCGAASAFLREMVGAARALRRGARLIEVGTPLLPFCGFDAHDHGAQRTAAMTALVDRGLGWLLDDLRTRGELDRTLVIVATEFDRTIAPRRGATGVAPDSRDFRLEEAADYGFHGHHHASNSIVCFGGGLPAGVVGETSEGHPGRVVRDPVTIAEFQATIRRRLGLA